MLHVTRNALTLLVVGFMLFSYTNADAKSKYYKVNIDGTHTTWYPGKTSSTYNVWIEEPFAVPDFPSINQHNPCRYGCVESSEVLTRCSGSGIHVANVPGIINQTFENFERDRQRQQVINAQTELLEAQTALARYQLRQAKRANRVQPTPAQQEAKQRSARKRLVQRAALAQSTDRADQAVQAREEAREETRQWKKYQDELDMWVTFVRTGAIGADTALKRYAINHPTKPVYPLRRRLKEAGLLHKQTNSRLSKVVEVLELVKAGKLTSEEAIAFCRTLYNKPKKHTGLSNGRMLTVGHTDDISLP